MLNTLRTLALRIIFLAALLYPLAVASRTAQAQTNANAQFVTANYFAVRGRTPDWTGWNFWYYALASGEVNDACVSSSTGSLQGLVTDPSGTPLPGAVVRYMSSSPSSPLLPKGAPPPNVVSGSVVANGSGNSPWPDCRLRCICSAPAFLTPPTSIHAYGVMRPPSRFQRARRPA